MKRMYLYMIGVVVFIGAVYAWRYRSDFRFLRDLLPARQTDDLTYGVSDQPIDWKPVDESAQGFRIEMPGESNQTVVQANNEAGSTEPISMLMAKPDSERTYAVAWADKPPVSRMNDLVPDKTLDQARDGALVRTSTTLVSEVRSSPQGYPGRDIVAHNAGGGILKTRLIYAGSKLYMLIATSPSASALHEDDVSHFFNSFAIATSNQIPETLPAATSR
jgi:hypothetical protein